MTKESGIKLFETKKVRTHWDESKEQWYFSVIDVVEILIDSLNPRDYWFKMNKGLKVKMELNCRQFVDSSNYKLPMVK